MPPRPSTLSKRAAVATSARPLPPLLIGGKSTHTDASRGFQTNLDPSPLPQQPSHDGTLMVIWLTASHSTQAAGTRHGRAQDASAITFQSGRADVSLLFGLVPGIVHSQSHPACVRKQSSGSRARSSTAGTCEWRDRDRDRDMAPGNEGIPSRRNAFTIRANGTPTPVSHAQHKMAEESARSLSSPLWRSAGH